MDVQQRPPRGRLSRLFKSSESGLNNNAPSKSKLLLAADYGIEDSNDSQSISSGRDRFSIMRSGSNSIGRKVSSATSTNSSRLTRKASRDSGSSSFTSKHSNSNNSTSTSTSSQKEGSQEIRTAAAAGTAMATATDVDTNHALPDRPVLAIGIAIYTFVNDKPQGLSFSKGSTILILAKLPSGWWQGFCAQTGMTGWFPSNYISLIRIMNGEDVSAATSPTTTTPTLTTTSSTTISTNSNKLVPNNSAANLATVQQLCQSSTAATPVDTMSLNNYATVETRRSSYAEANGHATSYWVPHVSSTGKLQYVNTERHHISTEIPFERLSVSSSTPTISPDSARRTSYGNSIRSIDTARTSTKTTSTYDESIPDSLVIVPEIASGDGEYHAIVNSADPFFRKPSLGGPGNAAPVWAFSPSWENGLIVAQDVTPNDDLQTWADVLTELKILCIELQTDFTDYANFSNHFTKISAHIQLLALYAGIPAGCYPSLKECGVLSLSFRKMINSLVKIGIFNDILAGHDNSQADPTIPARFNELVDALYENAAAFTEDLKDFNRRELMLRCSDDMQNQPLSSDAAEKFSGNKLPSIVSVFEVRHYNNTSHKSVFVKRDGRIDEEAENDRRNPVLAKAGLSAQNRRQSDLFDAPQLPLDNYSCSLNLTHDLVSSMETKQKATQSVLDQISRIIGDGKGTKTPRTREQSQDKRKVLASSLHVLVNLVSGLLSLIECFDLTIFYSCQLVPNQDNKSDSIVTDTSQTMTHMYDLLVLKPKFYQALYDLTNVLQSVEGTDESSLVAALSAQLEAIKMEEFYQNVVSGNEKKIEKCCKNMLECSLSLSKIVNVLAEEENAVLNAGRMMTTSPENIHHFPNSMGVGDNAYGRHGLSSSASTLSDEFGSQGMYSRARKASVADTVLSGSSLMSNVSSPDSSAWFLGLEYGDEIIYDKKGGRRGGTMRALVEQLTLHTQFMSEFNSAMFLTFQSFSNASELLSLLIARFMIQPPEGLSPDEFALWSEKKQKPIRLRVINVLKSWLENYWLEDEIFVTLSALNGVDELEEEAVDQSRVAFFQIFLKFAQQIKSQKFPGSNSLMNIIVKRMNTIEPWAKQQQKRIKLLKSSGSMPAPPPSILPKNLKKFKLSEVDPVEMARQLCVRDFKLFAEVTPFECLKRACRKTTFGLNISATGQTTIESVNGKSHCITRLITNSNHLTNWVSYAILRHSEPKRRATSIRYFIEVADNCRNYKNFSSMTAVISALYSSTIHRMKKSWDYVPIRFVEMLENMNRLMNSSRNFNEYRDVLSIVNPPAVPFFGVYLSDLTFVDEGNPDLLNADRGIINFAKRNKAAHIIQSIRYFQMTPYPFEEVRDIQLFLDHGFTVAPPIEEQYDTSLQFEPRNQRDKQQEAMSEDITNKLAANGIL